MTRALIVVDVQRGFDVTATNLQDEFAAIVTTEQHSTDSTVAR